MTKQITEAQVMEHNLQGIWYRSENEAESSDMNVTQNINSVKTGVQKKGRRLSTRIH